MSFAEDALRNVRRIDGERTAIEEEISGALAVLGPVGMEKALVDSDGFPRSDIDLYSVRTARQRVVMLRNDLKAKMHELDAALTLLHSFGPGILGPSKPPAATAASSTAASANAASFAQLQPLSVEYLSLPPFAVIDDVTAASPAAAAGLRIGDRIVEFGHLGGLPGGEPPAEGVTGAARPVPSLTEVGAATRSSEGKPMRVVVLRQDNTSKSAASAPAAPTAPTSPSVSGIVAVAVMLTPERWPGPGLLGCHVIPCMSR